MASFSDERPIRGGFLTSGNRCPATGGHHTRLMTHVLWPGEKFHTECQVCGMRIKVEGHHWVHEVFTIVEERDIMEELLGCC